MIDNPFIFYTASAFIIIFAVFALVSTRIIYSLLSAVIVFFFGALFFYLLGSEYNAIIQASVYGVAVPVVIGISIMFCSDKEKSEKHFAVPYLTVLCSCIFVLALIYIIMISLNLNADIFRIMDFSDLNAFDSLRAFAKGLYVNYVWAFELVSLLLTVIIAGIQLLKGKDAELWK